MTVASGVVAIECFSGQYGQATLSEVVLNLVLFIVVFSARGNICEMFRSTRHTTRNIPPPIF